MSSRVLKYKKVFVDSGRRLTSSNSSTDFEIELQENFECPANTQCYVTEIAIPNSFYTVEEGHNDFLYIELENDVTPVDSFYEKRSLQLSQGIYTPLGLIEHIITTANNLYAGAGITNLFTGSYEEKLNIYKIQAKLNYKAKFLTDDEIYETTDPVWSIIFRGDKRIRPQSINKMIGNYSATQTVITTSSLFTSFPIDLNPYRILYISCPELSNYNQHIPTGYSSSIIKKVLVNAGTSGTIYDEYPMVSDYIDVSHKNLKRLHFRIVDDTNKVVNLHGIAISFSLIFQKSSIDQD